MIFHDLSGKRFEGFEAAVLSSQTFVRFMTETDMLAKKTTSSGWQQVLLPLCTDGALPGAPAQVKPALELRADCELDGPSSVQRSQHPCA